MGESPVKGFLRVSEERVLDSWLFSVGRATFSSPDGEQFERFVVHHPGAVAVVPVDEHGMVTLVRQLRPAIWREVLEIPAGTCDVADEQHEDTARRELAEEVGLRAGELRPLVSAYNSPGFCDQVTTIYLATALTPCATDRHGVEERWMSIERVALTELGSLVAEGRLVDQTSILGLFLARQALEGPSGRDFAS
ncbi:MAG: NUDIX hydrolase [Actinomycetota bacterium]|nr:NUDIX hydrolase [Actinomycetota bacterium]